MNTISIYSKMHTHIKPILRFTDILGIMVSCPTYQNDSVMH